ncbi:hypothetical protein M1O29_01950 [Dehalococcoidia bacterium]|nr:hypothetical protein [Dehalococcoidia bacterium]
MPSTDKPRHPKADDLPPATDAITGAINESLFAEYGRAMQRVGQLEHELEMVARGAEAGRTDPGDSNDTLATQDETIAEHEATIKTLKSRITSLEAQLRGTEDQVSRMRDSNSPRRRRHHHHPWWQFWNRRS